MNTYYRLFILFVLLVALNACAGTRLKGSWVNPAYQGDGFEKILVLGVSDNETYLRMFENSLSRQLNKQGIAAEPGYTVFDTRKRPAKEAIVREISRKGFGAMIISKVTGRKTKEVYHPGSTYYVRNPSFMSPFRWRRHAYAPPYYRQHWYDYYSRSYDVIHEPGYVAGYEIVTVESNIYDTQTDALIWSGITESVVEGDMQGMIDSLVSTLIQELEEKRLI